MKLLEIWKRIGKQPLRITRQKEAIVFVDGEEYKISKIRYRKGEFIGFETELRYQWFSEMIKPEKDRFVIVRDNDGIEHTHHQWNGMCWYTFSGCDGWRSDVDIISWRYQEDK